MSVECRPFGRFPSIIDAAHENCATTSSPHSFWETAPRRATSPRSLIMAHSRFVCHKTTPSVRNGIFICAFLLLRYPHCAGRHASLFSSGVILCRPVVIRRIYTPCPDDGGGGGGEKEMERGDHNFRSVRLRRPRERLKQMDGHYYVRASGWTRRGD